MELTKQLQGMFDAAMMARDCDDDATELGRIDSGWPYSEDQLLDQGGMKRIYRCFDRRSSRWVARAEMLHPERDTRRFLREARLTAHLEHPNIMPVYEIGRNPSGAPYFTMKLSEGRSLEVILKELRDGGDASAFVLEKRLDLFDRVLDAMACAHQAGVIHLDLKPGNIQISSHGDVLVCDWGLARVLDEVCEDPLLLEHSIDSQELRTLTSHGFIKGSPGYMSPEQAGGPQVPKNQSSDIFSLGAILYSLLCFRAPFQGSAEEIIRATRKAKIVSINLYRSQGIIPSSLEAVCLKAMKLRPEDRYASVELMQRDLDAFRHGFATEAERASPLKLLLLAIRRHRIETLLLVTCLLVVILSSLGYLNKLQIKEEQSRLALERAKASELLLQAQVERTRRLGKESAPQFLQSALVAEATYDFKLAREYATIALNLDPELTLAWGTKGLIEFVSQDFAAAAESYNHLSPKFFYMEEWSREFALLKAQKDASLTADKWLDLYGRLKIKNRYVADRFLYGFCFSQAPLPLRLEIVEGVTRIWHSGVNFRFEIDGVELKIVGKEKLNHLYGLQGFPANKLDLSGSPIEDLNGLRGIPLEDLNLSHTSVRDLRPLVKLPLTKLNLAGCKLDSLEPLQQLPLRELDLRGCPALKLEQLQGCQYLRRVHLSSGQNLDAVKKLLPAVEWVVE